jgi:hypothetical protein
MTGRPWKAVLDVLLVAMVREKFVDLRNPLWFGGMCFDSWERRENMYSWLYTAIAARAKRMERNVFMDARRYLYFVFGYGREHSKRGVERMIKLERAMTMVYGSKDTECEGGEVERLGGLCFKKYDQARRSASASHSIRIRGTSAL